MDLINIIVAGISGTLLMTVFMDLASLITGYNFHVPTLLGTMLTMSTKPSGKVSQRPASIITGYAAHYLVGMVFSLIYYAVLNAWHWPDNLSNTLIFGLLAGVTAITFWFTFFRLHPLAPAVNLKLYLVFIFIGHLIFSLGMHWGYLLMTDIAVKQ